MINQQARDDQREENNMPMLNDAQEQGRMLVIDEAKVAHEILAVARMLCTAEYGDRIIAEVRGNHVRIVGKANGPTYNNNFLVICDYGDYSGFMSLRKALQELDKLVSSRPGKYFAVVER